MIWDYQGNFRVNSGFSVKVIYFILETIAMITFAEVLTCPQKVTLRTRDPFVENSANKLINFLDHRAQR